MNYVWPIFKREFAAYFATPLAYVFIVIFLFAMGAFTFYVGHFLRQRRRRSRRCSSAIIPGSICSWCRRSPCGFGRRSAAPGRWSCCSPCPSRFGRRCRANISPPGRSPALRWLLTFPIWLTVNYLGNPDNGVILASYIGSFLMAGGYLAIGACISAATNNQVIAFVVSVVVCFLFTISGAPLVLDFFRAWAPLPLIDARSPRSASSRTFTAITAGVIDLRDLIFFFSLIALFLAANVVHRRSEEERLRHETALPPPLRHRRHRARRDHVRRRSTSPPIRCVTTARLDLTENGRLHARRRHAQHHRQHLREPITLKFFYSKKVGCRLCADSAPMPSACAIC